SFFMVLADRSFRTGHYEDKIQCSEFRVRRSEFRVGGGETAALTPFPLPSECFRTGHQGRRLRSRISRFHALGHAGCQPAIQPTASRRYVSFRTGHQGAGRYRKVVFLWVLAHGQYEDKHSVVELVRADALVDGFGLSSILVGTVNGAMEMLEGTTLAGGVEIRRLYIAAGHKFFGHHGKPAGENPIVEVAELECVAGRGVRGDRFFDFKESYKGQITFFAWETYEAICRALAVQDKPLFAFRRNVITAGADLNEWIGREFQIQGVNFRGTEECRPCYWMDQAFAPGANEFLQGRGGLRAVILNDGILRVGNQ
ncbi:MAG: molybdenum cofactor biosysynthesis protein, partial [Pedosphaera sp.]|nr:molybdenum cofactor biosysynthesis protein [Pedosphaera sp.]